MLPIGEKMTFSFVIPNYKNTDLIVKCLESIRQFYKEDEVIVCDDGSTKEVQLELKGICKAYNAKLLTSFWNNGFGHTSNRGLEQAKGDIIVLVNNDIIFTQDIRPETERIFNSDSKIGIVGYLLYYPNGNIQHSGLKHIGNSVFGHHDHNISPKVAKIAFKSRYEIGVTGALMSFRKSALDEIGGFKAGYILAFEDVELCLRYWHCGWRIFYSAGVSAIHVEGATRGRDSESKKKAGSFEQEQISQAQYFRDVRIFNLNELFKKVAQCNSSQKWNGIKSIGIQRMNALGDCVMATGVVNYMTELYPNTEIRVCTKNPYPFLGNKKIKEIVCDPEELKSKSEMVINLDMSYEDEPKRAVWHTYAGKCLDIWEEKDIKPIIYDSQIDRLTLLEKIKANSLKIGQNFFVIHPSVGWEAKLLPSEVWEQVIGWITAEGYKVVIVGTMKDLSLKKRELVYDMRGKLELGEIRELIKASKCFVGIDSGIMHIALTTNTSVVGIFSAANPSYFVHRPYKTRAVIPNSACRYCRHDQPGITVLTCYKGTNECIKSIESDNIITAIKGLI